MRSRLSTIALAGVAALAWPAGAAAQAKVRIAIWDFENNSEHHWWFSDQLGPAARNQIDTAFGQSSTLSKHFSVVERDKLDLVMKEQGLGTTGALDQQTAAKVGQVLGIRYILTGAIDKFSINTTKGGIGGFGAAQTKAEAEINIRLIDTTTAERIATVSGEADVKKGGIKIKSVNLSQEAEWGIASEAIEKAAEKVVAEFEKGRYWERLSGAGVEGGGEGKIIKVEGNRAWINMGSMSGISVGDSYGVFSVGEALVDPDTGQVLGVDETETGSGQIVEVDERFSIMTFTGKAAAKDVVRKK